MRSIARAVEFEPAPAITGISPRATPTAIVMSVACSATLRVGDSPVVPHTTKSLVSIQCGIYPRIDPEPYEAEKQGISQTKIDAALRVYGKVRKVEALASLLIPVLPNHVLVRALAGKHRQPESVAELRGRRAEGDQTAVRSVILPFGERGA